MNKTKVKGICKTCTQRYCGWAPHLLKVLDFMADSGIREAEIVIKKCDFYKEKG